MFLKRQRSLNLVDVCDSNQVEEVPKYNSITNVKNYLLVKSALSISDRDLNSTVGKQMSAHSVISSKPSSSSMSTIHPSMLRLQKHARNKNSFYAYRSSSNRSNYSERDQFIDELNLLTNSFTIDRMSLLPSSTFFHTHYLPKIQKYHNSKPRSSSKMKTNHRSFFEYADFVQPISMTTIHQTKLSNQHHTDKISDVEKPSIRKQLHVRIPELSY